LVELELAEADPLVPEVAAGMTTTLELPPAPPVLDEVPVVDPPVLDVCADAGAPRSSTPPVTTTASRAASAVAFRTAPLLAQLAPVAGAEVAAAPSKSTTRRPPVHRLRTSVPQRPERELVREAAGQVIAGQRLITIARDGNRRRVAGTTASP
jgi:hypothetical protein